MNESYYQNSKDQSMLKKIVNFRKEILLFSTCLAMIFCTISALIPPSYKAFSSVVVNQKSVDSMDAYREAKSSEFTARTVREMILSNSFMWSILDDNIIWKEMDKRNSQDEKIKYWKKKVKVSVVPNTGVLSIVVYTRNKNLSKEILNKIVDQLQDDSSVILSNKEATIEVINEPYYFHQASSPNLLLNTILGFVVGIILSITFVFLDRKYHPHAI